MGWGLQRTASLADSEEETVLIITALDEDSDDEDMSAYISPRAADSGRKRVLCAGLLLAVLVLCAAWFGPAGGHSQLTGRRAERLTQVGLLWCCARPCPSASMHVPPPRRLALSAAGEGSKVPAPPPAAIAWWLRRCTRRRKPHAQPRQPSACCRLSSRDGRTQRQQPTCMRGRSGRRT